MMMTGNLTIPAESIRRYMMIFIGTIGATKRFYFESCHHKKQVFAFYDFICFVLISTIAKETNHCRSLHKHKKTYRIMNANRPSYQLLISRQKQCKV